MGHAHLDDALVSAQSASQVPARVLQRPLAHQIGDCSSEQDGASSWPGEMLYKCKATCHSKIK